MDVLQGGGEEASLAFTPNRHTSNPSPTRLRQNLRESWTDSLPRSLGVQVVSGLR